MVELIGRFRDPSDLSEKYVFKNEDGIIEISRVSPAREDREALCLPSMYACGLGCTFCHLTTMKIEGKNKKIPLEALHECVKRIPLNTKKPRFLYCYMGIGDPILNLELVQDTVSSEALTDDFLAVGTSISTIIPSKKGFEALIAKNLPVKVHFSLHSTIDSVRKSLVPCSATTVVESLELLSAYREQISREHNNHFKTFYKHNTCVEIHYTLIDGGNDSDEELSILLDLVRRFSIPIKFIRFNPTAALKRSPKDVMWVSAINEAAPGLARFHEPPGRNIGASCGEFSRHFYSERLGKKEQEEFIEYKNRFSF